MSITKWIQKRKLKAEKSQYIAGYNYAAGALLRGDETPISLESQYCYGNWTPFDRGANDAMVRLIRGGIVEDDNV